LEKSATKNERVGKQGNTKLLSEIMKTEKTTEKTATGKMGSSLGNRKNSATKNDSVCKRETQSYRPTVSRRDGNSCLGNRKKWQSENVHLFMSRR